MRLLPTSLTFVVTLCLVCIPAITRADHEFFPNSDGVFAPLRADPRELQYALRLLLPVSHRLSGEAAIGDYLGILRWSTDTTSFQVNGGGGVFGRFDLAAVANDMKTADFFANVPLDWRSHRWSGRAMIYHSSSHLGDDYLKTSGRTTQKHSWDNLRNLVAFSPSPRLRLYGGYTYAFRRLPRRTGRNSVQGGVEWMSMRISRHFEYYGALDIQSWQRADWTPTYVSQAGLRVYKSDTASRGVAFFLELAFGPRPEGQFFKNKETRWSVGTRFYLL
jgi:hypothetical protein